MKKRGLLYIMIIIALFMLGSSQGKWPFKDLTREDIVSAAVVVSPPDKSLEIKDEFQLNYLVDALNSVVIYKEVSMEGMVSRPLVQFTLKLKNGNTVKVEPAGAQIIVNDTGYKAKQESSLELFTLGTRLVSN